MNPELRKAIAAARVLAWHSHVNLMPKRLAERHAAHDRLVERLRDLRPLPRSADPLLVYLVAAMHRLAACSFANRRGVPYYERKQAFAELRGCLAALDREAAA